MDDETQLKVRKFLKRLGISSQQELNQFIENNPETALQFFERFFKRNSLPIIVKFLTNTANLFETLKIIISLPKISLIKSVFEIR